MLDGYKPKIVSLTDGTATEADLWIHDEQDLFKAQILSRLFDDPSNIGHFPRPFGVLYAKERMCYDEAVQLQLHEAVAKKGTGDLDALLRGRETWEIA
jgi:2-oxoglutarate/2-oxoacid ferredoxin oxidoreductase subunit beta